VVDGLRGLRSAVEEEKEVGANEEALGLVWSGGATFLGDERSMLAKRKPEAGMSS